jgi:hypothetical protein
MNPAPETLPAALARCLREILTLLGATPAGDAPLEDLLREYGTAKARLGRKAVAGQLGLNEADLGEFDRALRRAADASPGGEIREDRIAALRALLWCETIWTQGFRRPLELRLQLRADEDVGRKQVRAIELICRALLAEGRGDQQQLVAWLQELFRPEVVEKWVRAGSPGDVLSGTTFSELTSLFLSEEAFARHRPIFERARHLSLLGDKRRTLQVFLEDVRRIRNNFAHHKVISPLQLALLEHHFEELSAPVQAAFDRGETRVDPEAFIDVSREELTGYFAAVREDLQEVKGDLAALKASLEAKLERIGEDVASTARTVRGTDRRLRWVLGGVAALLVLGGLGLHFSRETGRTAAAIQGDTARIRTDTATMAQAAKQTEAATAAVQAGATRVEEEARRIGTQAEALRRDGQETRAAAQEAATAAKAASSGLQEAAGRMEGAAQRTAEAVREVAVSVQGVAAAGGIIPNPVTPEDFYRNARLHELRNEFAAARRNYERFLRDAPEVIDPYLAYATILKSQEGIEGARATLAALQRENRTASLRTATTTLLPREKRVEALRAIVREEPGFAPAAYLLSSELGAATDQTRAERAEERRLLQAFLELHRAGGLLRLVLDKPLAEKWVQEAEDRLRINGEMATAVPDAVTFLAIAPMPPVKNEWSVMVMLFEPATAAEYTLNDGAPVAIEVPVMLPLKLPAGDHLLKVFYRDARGERQGPFEHRLEQADQRLKTAKSLVRSRGPLAASIVPGAITGGSARLDFRSTLITMNGAVRSIRYGINQEAPDAEFTVPEDTASLDILARKPAPDVIPLRKSTRFVSFQFVFRDGSTSEVYRREVD